MKFLAVRRKMNKYSIVLRGPEDVSFTITATTKAEPVTDLGGLFIRFGDLWISAGEIISFAREKEVMKDALS
jgi:hypothetical protein